MAFCTNCGAQLPDGSKFCTSCGAKFEAPKPAEETQHQPGAPAQESAPVQGTYQPAQQNYISGYSFTRTGRVVDGVEIVLDRTTRKPAPTPELTLPDETNKGRFKPNKQKSRKRNMIR